MRLFTTFPCRDAEFLIDKDGKYYWTFWGTHHGRGIYLHVRYRVEGVGTVESICYSMKRVDWTLVYDNIVVRAMEIPQRHSVHIKWELNE
jgi:hypothetical protein